MPKHAKNLAETRDRIKRDRERRYKRLIEYRRKIKRLIERYNFAIYVDNVFDRKVYLDTLAEFLHRRLEVYKKGFVRFFIDILYNRVQTARRRLSRWMSRLQVSYDLIKGYVPVITKFVGHKIELYIDEKVEEFLKSPEYFESTRDALTIIFSDILRHRYRIEMRPEDIERLKGILAFLYERYYAPFREMPCRESKYIVKLTPLTFYVFQNQPVRLYVLRYIKIDALRNPYTVMVTKPVDVMLSSLRVRKPREENVALSSIAGESSAFAGTEDVIISRDANRNPRRLLKAYVAMRLGHRISEALARQMGIRHRLADVKHCSLYASLEYGKLYRAEREIDYWYRRRYRAIMAW